MELLLPNAPFSYFQWKTVTVDLGCIRQIMIDFLFFYTEFMTYYGFGFELGCRSHETLKIYHTFIFKCVNNNLNECEDSIL